MVELLDGEEGELFGSCWEPAELKGVALVDGVLFRAVEESILLVRDFPNLISSFSASNDSTSNFAGLGNIAFTRNPCYAQM